MTEEDGSRRLELVRTAQQQWIEALTDLGGRNTLLYYKDRRAGTLDLAQADPEALDRFTERGSMSLTRLFKDVDLRADAIRRIQVIHRKARELFVSAEPAAPAEPLAPPENAVALRPPARPNPVPRVWRDS